MTRIVSGIVLLPIAALLVTGCATRDWVREALGKRQAEIDERFVTVDKRMADESQRVEGMGFRLKTVETGVGEASEAARGARERADAAQTRADAAHSKAEDVDGRLTRLWTNLGKRDLVETQQIQFAFDKWELNDSAQTSLASLVKELQANPKLTVDLEGYADPKGTYGYNVALSQRRVEAVRRYLVEKGIELPRIHLIGLGPIMDGGLPDVQKRRVTVKLMVASE